MKYTVIYTKSNSFIKQNGDPRLVTYKNGEPIADNRYVKPTVSRAVRSYYPAIDYQRGKFLIGLDQKELDQLVKEIGFYDDHGALITSAPLRNPEAPFWRHKNLKVQLSGSGTTFDDEIPLDRFWIECFKADYRFQFAGDEITPSLRSRVHYTVTKITDKVDEVSKSSDESFEAFKILTSLEDDHQKLVTILRAMGTDVRDPEPKLVRQALQKKITDHKDLYIFDTGERNIEAFIRLAKTPTQQMAVKAMITQAKTQGIIFKKKNNYYYGDLPMGSSLAKVEAYLNNKDNEDIKMAIITQLKN